MTLTARPPGKRWRDQDIDRFSATVDVAAAKLGVQPLAVEKDYWVCRALNAITSEFPDNIVFKGGTSLEKLRIIQRFSEDLDLLVMGDLGNEKATRKVMKEMVAAAERATEGTQSDAKSGGGVGWLHRQAYLQPPLKKKSAAGFADASAVLVELGQSGGPNPSSKHTIESLLARELSKSGTNVSVDDWEDLRPFPVTILAPGRTLIEKLLRVNNYAVDPDAQKSIHGLPRIGRQFYDIWALLKHPGVQSLLADKEVVSEMLESIREISAAFGSDAPVPEGGFAQCEAFNPDSRLATGLRAEHQNAMRDLYYGDPETAPTFEDVLRTVQQNANLLNV